MKGAACLLIALLFLAAIPVLVRCDRTLLNGQVLLNADNASQSYKFDLTSGDMISITLGVTGQGLIDFHIMNSSDSQLLNRYDLGTEGWQGQWTVPYNDRFEFVIELTLVSIGDADTVSITLTSGGTSSPQPSPTSSATLVNEQFTLRSAGYLDSFMDFYVNMTRDDTISLSVSTNGSKISLRIYNSTDTQAGLLLERPNITSLNEQWSAPYNDNFDFYFYVLEGTALVHFTVQRPAGGGGFDPLPIAVIVIFVVAALLAVFLIVRMKRQPPPPPPPPPPPETPPP
jgi:mannose-6-phosphate isomerase-like protein (cupin superfamily)